jgi:hypothetical protein
MPLIFPSRPTGGKNLATVRSNLERKLDRYEKRTVGFASIVISAVGSKLYFVFTTSMMEANVSG